MTDRPIYRTPHRPDRAGRPPVNRRFLRLVGGAAILIVAGGVLGDGIVESAAPVETATIAKSGGDRPGVVAALRSRRGLRPRQAEVSAPARIAGDGPSLPVGTDAGGDRPASADTPPTFPSADAGDSEPGAAPGALARVNGAPTPAPPRTGPGEPANTVIRFYQLLEQGQYEALTPLWSDRRRASVAWDPKVLRSRASAGTLTVRQAEVTVLDEPAGRAVVAVDVLEVTGPAPLGHRRYVGTWRLVRGPAGWLLDEPNLEVE